MIWTTLTWVISEFYLEPDTVLTSRKPITAKTRTEVAFLFIVVRKNFVLSSDTFLKNAKLLLILQPPSFKQDIKMFTRMCKMYLW